MNISDSYEHKHQNLSPGDPEFARGVKIAEEQFYEDPLGAPLIPNWNRVISAFPHFFEELKAAVEEDNERSEDD